MVNEILNAATLLGITANLALTPLCDVYAS